MSRETECIIDAIAATTIPYVVTDINTPGVHAVRGNHYKKDCVAHTPFHPLDVCRGAIGRAVDFAHRRGSGSDTPELFAIYEFFAENYGSRGLLNELYYSGPGADYCVRGGKFMKWSAVPTSTRTAIRKTHHNHVHVAVPKGVFLIPVESKKEEDDVPKPDTKVDACNAPGGGVWTLTYDGGVRATGGAPFYGSYPGLPAKDRKGSRNFVSIEAVGDGYTIHSDDDNGSSYHFNPEVFDRLKKNSL